MPKLNITMKIDKINQIFEDEFNLFASEGKKELCIQSEIDIVVQMN